MESKDWSGFGYLSPDFSPGMPVSQRIWTPRGFGPASGYGPPFADLDPPYQTFHLSILCIIFAN